MHPLVVTHEQPESPEAEAFRALRGAILFSPGFRDRMVIQVASPRPGEGTTTLVSNLAVSIGKAGKRVLVVDCNLGRPRIHQMFGITPEAGLSTFVRGGTRLDDVTSATASDNLCVVPCGSMSQEEVGELLSQPRFDEFIESARQGYDVVLLDSADLQMSDAMAVAARADAVLLHIRLGENSRPESIQARQMLAELGTEVLGVAVRGAKR
jgi:capsular exopolysaccharide synthesis family protein